MYVCMYVPHLRAPICIPCTLPVAAQCALDFNRPRIQDGRVCPLQAARWLVPRGILLRAACTFIKLYIGLVFLSGAARPAGCFPCYQVISLLPCSPWIAMLSRFAECCPWVIPLCSPCCLVCSCGGVLLLLRIFVSAGSCKHVCMWMSCTGCRHTIVIIAPLEYMLTLQQ